MPVFTPPKIEVDLEDLHKIFLLGLRLNFWDLDFLTKNLSDGFLPDNQTDYFGLLIATLNQSISKIPSNSIISFLQNFYLELAQKNDTKLFIYLCYFAVSKKRFPEMIAFSYKKLPSQRELTDNIRTLLKNLQPKLG